jgi:hypothetical protein
MAKNPYAKRVEPEAAYEVWEDASGKWRWFVLKKYKSPEREAKDPYARYFCAVQSPITNGRFEYGDVYALTVKNGNHRIANPLVSSTVQEDKKTLIVQALTDEVREHFTVIDLTPKARKHKNYQIELPIECVHTISPERSIIGPIDYYDCQDGRVIVVDHAWQQANASIKKKEETQ